MKKNLFSSINLVAIAGLFSLVVLTACTENSPQPPSVSNAVPNAVQTKAAAPATETAKTPLKEITIAFATRRETKDLQRKADQVAVILSKELGIPIKAIIADETASVEALNANRANVAFLSGRASLKAEQLAGSKMY
ncbi:MAG: PhnD/SsuA/transferrin family substrate-binding protein, partial [Pseudanabaena sp. ELA748]